MNVKMANARRRDWRKRQFVARMRREVTAALGSAPLAHDVREHRLALQLGSSHALVRANGEMNRQRRALLYRIAGQACARRADA